MALDCIGLAGRKRSLALASCCRLALSALQRSQLLRVSYTPYTKVSYTVLTFALEPATPSTTGSAAKPTRFSKKSNTV